MNFSWQAGGNIPRKNPKVILYHFSGDGGKAVFQVGTAWQQSAVGYDQGM